MKIRHHGVKLMTLVVVVTMPLLGLSGIASAKAAVGSAKWCAAHPKLAKTTPACSTSTGKGTGGDPPTITVQIDPNPLVETGQSYVLGIVQVETSPSFAGDTVDISSSQLQSACLEGAYFAGIVAGGPTATVTLDDDGNATVYFYGYDCAPGPSVVEADLTVAPYYTALATLDALPPVVTTPGVTGFPTTSGTVSGGEVETGDTSFPGDGSYVYGVFYVETDPVYAEQTVEISSPELQDRCGTYWSFDSFSAGSAGRGTTFTSPNTTATAILDDDGNAVFLFEGASCAAGSSVVTADVEAGTHPTYTTTFDVLPPQPTI